MFFVCCRLDLRLLLKLVRGVMRRLSNCCWSMVLTSIRLIWWVVQLCSGLLGWLSNSLILLIYYSHLKILELIKLHTRWVVAMCVVSTRNMGGSNVCGISVLVVWVVWCLYCGWVDRETYLLCFIIYFVCSHK